MDKKLPLPRPTKPRGTTAEIVKVLILAAISFVAGFALIFFFLRPSAPDIPANELPQTASDLSAQGEGAETPNTPAPKESPKTSSVAPVPPGETPDGLSQSGQPHYLKCWDKTGIETDGNKCDRLIKLENRFTERLYVVNECTNEHSGDHASGKLVVACEVNFHNKTISFWSGASSNVRNASDIGDCLRNKLAGLPIEAIGHNFSRYRIYFPIEFSTAKMDVAISDTQKPSTGASVPPSGAGRLVNVIKDRVRVRKTPVNGAPIGKISSGNQVRLLKQQGEWCHIVTPNSNEGWMICNALQI